MAIKQNQIVDEAKTLSATSSAPTTGSGKGAFFTKTVGGITEGFYVDSAGTQIQVTSNGAITGGGGGGASVSDAVFGIGWNGVTTDAPSKNAVYDKIATVDTSVSSLSSSVSTINSTLAGKQDALAAPSQAEAEAGTSQTLRAWTAQRVAQAIAALAPSGGSGGETSEWKSFASGDVKLLCTGSSSDLAAVTVTKVNNVITVSLPGTAPYSVKLHSMKVRVSASDMSGQTSVTLNYPEPTGETSTALSVRAQFNRFNTAYVYGGSTTTTVANTSGTMQIVGSGFSSGQEAYAQFVF